MTELTSFYRKLSHSAKTDKKKIQFFNENQPAFFMDPQAIMFENAIKIALKIFNGFNN